MNSVPVNLSGRRVLVTGARGFIGAHLCARLLGEGAEVHAVSRAPENQPAGNCRWWRGNLADVGVASALMAEIRPEIVFHLASHVAGSRDLALVRPTLDDILVATVQMLTAAVESGCSRVVLAGSLEESLENSEVPSSPYAAAKSAASNYARMFQSLYGLKTITLRIAMVYGPAQGDATKLIPYVIRSLISGAAPELSSGERCVDWIYVDDVVDAFLAAACAGEGCPWAVDVGSGTSNSIRQVVERLCQLINPAIHPLFGAVANRPLDRSWVADRTAASQFLGWQAVHSLDEGLRKTVEWHRNVVSAVSSPAL